MRTGIFAGNCRARFKYRKYPDAALFETRRGTREGIKLDLKVKLSNIVPRCRYAPFSRVRAKSARCLTVYLVLGQFVTCTHDRASKWLCAQCQLMTSSKKQGGRHAGTNALKKRHRTEVAKTVGCG